MGIAARKEREKREMREKIIRAATRIFLEKGFEKASIRNIAAAIEYSPATIYLYFHDKNEIFFAIQQKGFAIFTQMLKQKEESYENPFERLKGLGSAYATFAQENAELYDLMFIMRAPTQVRASMAGSDIGNESYAVLRRTVEACLHHGYITAPMESLDHMTMGIWAMVHGAVSLCIRDRMKDQSDTGNWDLIHQTIQLVTDQLRHRPLDG